MILMKHDYHTTMLVAKLHSELWLAEFKHLVE